MGHILEVRHLEKSFGDVRAVQDVSFSVARGEIYGLLGPNGAGKSTTIHCVTGLLRASAGAISIGGHDVASMESKRCLGFVPDDLSLPETLTGREYLHFVKRVFGVQGTERLDLLAQVFWLVESLDRLIREYSHGMRKKLQLMSALLHDPVCLIMDEPFRGLDPEAMLVVQHVLDTRRDQGYAALIATHDLRRADEACDRLGIVADGRLVAEGRPRELEASFDGRSLLDVYLEASGLAKRANDVRELLRQV